MVYTDTNILVAYYCPESISDQVEEILVNTDSIAISQLTEVELSSAVSRKIGESNLTQQDGRDILSIFHTHIEQKNYVHLPIQPSHFSIATDWISLFNTSLRTLDALHLAIASKNNIPILTADIKLAGSANILDVDVNLVT